MFPLPSLQLVRILTLLLEAQATSVWTDSYTQKIFQMILNFTIHPKPKVSSGEGGRSEVHCICTSLVSSPQLRKAAQGGVVSMLRDGTSTGDFHPAAPPTAKHCKHVIQQGGVAPCGLHTSLAFHPPLSVCLSVCLSACPLPPSSGIETASLHTLVMMKDCLANFPTSVIQVQIKHFAMCAIHLCASVPLSICLRLCLSVCLSVCSSFSN